MSSSKDNLQIKGIRGATTCSDNTTDGISSAVNELVSELVKRNKLEPANIISITFSATNDLTACFPAGIARQYPGWGNIALLDCQHMYVKGDLSHCIRILAHVLLPTNQIPQHPYLRKAQLLRPDRT